MRGEARILLAELAAKGATAAADGERLKISAPDGVMTPAIAERIRDLKPQLLALLREYAAIPLADRSKPLPLGVVQERMWAHAQMEPEALIYNLPAAWRFQGAFDVERFCAAFAGFVARHEAMRTRIRIIDGAPVQIFSDAPAALEVEDLSLLAAEARANALAESTEALRVRHFDLEREAPYVARLYRLGAAEHALFFMPHHLIWDGWCFDIFLRDLCEIYSALITGRGPRLSNLNIQYTDYALWHRKETENGRWSQDFDFWAGKLSPQPAPPNLPSDLARPMLFSQEGDWVDFILPAEALARVKALAAQHRATTFMTFLAAWRAFLARISGEEDIVIGAPVQARQHADVGDVVGCFVNTIFLRQPIDLADGLGRAIAGTRETCVEAYAHQEAPVELLVDRLVPRRDPSRTPLSQAMFSHQQVSRRPLMLGEASIEQIHVNPRSSPTDLMLAVMEREEIARVVLHYATTLYSRALARSLISSFAVFFEAAVENPGDPLRDLPLVDAQDRKRIAFDLNVTNTDYDRTPAHDLIARAALRHPDKSAIICGDKTTTYAALLARSDAIGGRLAAMGVASGDIVGLMMARSPDMIAAALGVWRLGASYLPLDPTFPEQRLAYMAEDSGAKLILSDSAGPDFGGRIGELRVNIGESAAHLSPAGRGRICAANPGEGEGLVRGSTSGSSPSSGPSGHLLPDGEKGGSARAYVIYTSGSTGKPKGVEVGHGALSNFIQSMLKTPGVASEDRALALTTLSFDISILELFVPLAAGAAVVLASAEEAADGADIARLIRGQNVTMMQATPATWRLLIDSGWSGAKLRALSGGEALPAALVGELLPRVSELWNMYGPTETTIWSSCKRITDAEDITIGRPIANTRLYVVDSRGELMPEGVPGELWIGGEGVAIGYLGRADLTGERFLADPFAGKSGARVYRTGDLARLRPDGEVDILGRIDAQVKLRGFRIELGEIEAALESHDAVAKAVAAVKPDAAGEPALVAYLQYREGQSATGSELRRKLRRALPAYMLPQHFIEVASFPLTGSGKVDRKALPPPSAGVMARAARTPPRNDLERSIADVWKGILSVNDISVTDNFFELGGQSLQAAQMAARVKERTGLKISPRAVIFETLEQLAASAS